MLFCLRFISSYNDDEFCYSSVVNVINEEDKVKLGSYAIDGHGHSAHLCRIGLC